MLSLIWRERALEQLDDIAAYIAARDPDAAERLQSLIESAAERIVDRPFMHRPGRAPGTREAIVHPNYILVYKVTGDAVEVVNVLHARQQYP